MNQNVKGFGFRGWMLMIYQFLAYLAKVCFTNWPMNALGDFYDPVMGAQGVSKIYTMAAVIGVVVQVIASPFIGKIKNIHALSIVMGVISMVAAFGVMMCAPGTLWNVSYFVTCLVLIIWCTFVIGILIGQWFPRRKGVVMGLVTIAFPIGNALMGPVLGKAMGMTMGMAAEGAPYEVIVGAVTPVVRSAFLPFFIIICIGIVIGAVLVKDYPEMVGAYRDNDKSMTPEMAKAMMEFEIENKKTSVWTLGKTLACPDFWLITLPMGFLLMAAVGMMTQTANIFGSAGIIPGGNEFNMVMMVNAIFAIVGSYGLGLLDTKIGTRKSMLIAMALMVVSGILGVIGGKTMVVAAMWILGIFMGASSNFGVSLCAQYWRREDFGRVFALMSPIGSAISSASPVIIAGLLFGATGYKGHSGAFAFVLIFGIVALILMIAFNPKSIIARDNKYREKAGKPLDDALVGRK